MAASKLKICLAFDVKTTGAFVGRDKLVVVSFAYIHDGKVVTWKVVADLPKYEHETWRQCWERNGWEMNCWETCWIEREHILNGLMNDPGIDKLSESDMAFEINKYLQELESQFEIEYIVSDTIAYDGVFINYFLVSHGYAPICYTRDMQRYIQGFEIKSYVHGIFLCPDGKFNIPRNMKILDRMLPFLKIPVRNYNPDVTVAYIIIVFEKSRALAAKLKSTLLSWFLELEDPSSSDEEDADDARVKGVTEKWCNSLKFH